LSALAGEGLIEKTRGALILLQSHVLEERLVETTREVERFSFGLSPNFAHLE
jgi:hypothetical protein